MIWNPNEMHRSSKIPHWLGSLLFPLWAVWNTLPTEFNQISEIRFKKSDYFKQRLKIGWKTKLHSFTYCVLTQITFDVENICLLLLINYLHWHFFFFYIFLTPCTRLYRASKTVIIKKFTFIVFYAMWNFQPRFLKGRWSYCHFASLIWRTTTFVAMTTWMYTVLMSMGRDLVVSVGPSSPDPSCPQATRCSCRWCLMPTLLAAASLRISLLTILVREVGKKIGIWLWKIYSDNDCLRFAGS